ncbi:hypothetical protein AVEN_166438-1 [Araneus ventricosus]|uniref:Uncharacterized protein n=1 Tax=Araneus ventricosus TaxID=182803 RepID=A0A4Y2F104_ARAVE|nr:hypothetical protein AVEN_166438-1 [Araneus ventricosus]
MQLCKLFGGQFLVVVFLKLIDIIFYLVNMILAKDTISFTAGSTGTRSNPSKSHSTTLSSQSFFQAEARVLLVSGPPREPSLPRIFDHLEAGNEVGK